MKTRNKEKTDFAGCFFAGVIMLVIAAATAELLVIVDAWLNK